MSQQWIANTAEGCSIRRDRRIGFLVECGERNTRPHHVATLEAAYALCQRLLPLRLKLQA